MTELWQEAGEDFYKTLFETFESHPSWEYSDEWMDRDRAPEESAQAPANTDRLEYSIEHTGTDAILTAGIPDLTSSTPYAVSGTLWQSMTRGESHPEDRLVSALEQAHGSVSRRAVNDEVQYVEPVEDVSKVATIQVPFDYEQGSFDSAVDNLSMVAENINRVHSEVLDVLDGYSNV